MSNDLVVKTNSAPSDHEMMVFQTMAKNASLSKMYKNIGDESGIMMIMLAARELGIPPVMALNGGINIIQGKVELSARMMSALIRKSGHRMVVKESDEQICTIEGSRCDTGEKQLASYTFAEAQKAGLVKNGGGWVKCPKDMLFARAMSRLARQLFSDVIGIGYVEGEIRASDAEIVMPADIVHEEPKVSYNTEEMLQEILNKYDDEDKYRMMEYIKVVCNHFGWTQDECIVKFSKEEKLDEKFKIWKEKQP